MLKAKQIAKFLDKELKVKSIKENAINGLQVDTNKNIEKVGFAVDGCLSTFKKAKKLNVDLLVVHHGVKRKEIKDKYIHKRRIEFLKKAKIAIYGVHLPLDLHKKYGNNINLFKILNLKNIKGFGKYHGITIGYSGNFNKQINIKEVTNILNKNLKTKCNIFQFGKNKIRNIGIVSGGGADSLKEAFDKKLDCFLTGEISYGTYNRAKEYGVNLIVGGHYATETLGVKALIPLINKKFNIKTIFIEDKKYIKCQL